MPLWLSVLANYAAERREKDAGSPGTKQKKSEFPVVLSRQIMYNVEQGKEKLLELQVQVYGLSV